MTSIRSVTWACPKCATPIRGVYYESYNTFGGRLFSDTYIDAPMAAPIGHEYVGCPKCNNVFLPDPRKDSVNEKVADVQEGLPLWQKMKILLDTNAAKSVDERRHQLLLNLWAENHDVRISRDQGFAKQSSEEISIRVRSYNKYADELIEFLRKEDNPESDLLLSEVLRERGRFDEAQKVLEERIYSKKDIGGNFLIVADQMKEHIDTKIHVPFEVIFPKVTKPTTQPKVTGGNLPKTVDEAVEQIIRQFGPEEMQKVAAMKKEDLDGLHFSLGLWVRNNTGLYRGNEALIKDIKKRNVDMAMFLGEDEMSSLIIKALWARLQELEQ